MNEMREGANNRSRSPQAAALEDRDHEGRSAADRVQRELRDADDFRGEAAVVQSPCISRPEAGVDLNPQGEEMTYDRKCYDLAMLFLESQDLDEQERHKHADTMAQDIQIAIEKGITSLTPSIEG